MADAIAELTGHVEDAETEAEMNAGLIENLQRGLIEVTGRNPENGELLFKITEAGGRHRAESMRTGEKR